VADQQIKYGLAPIARGDARLLILGSLPGDASLAAAQYYAHPTNQFWKLLGAAMGEPLAELGYEQRLERLAERRVALWDVIGSAVRRGSLDQAIRGAGHNPVRELLAKLPQLEAVAFNGAAAAGRGRALVPAGARLQLIDLPSSSAANTRPIAEKAAAWARLADWCAPPQIAAR
jgi:double-stranded uracil-DNA glycosylase